MPANLGRLSFLQLCNRCSLVIEASADPSNNHFLIPCSFFPLLQSQLYEETFSSLIDSVLDGFNGTIFAYGQTGTGKTFTMEGIKQDPELKGVIPRSFEHIFTHISISQQDEQYLVRASYLEIYQEDIRDLLAKDQNRRLELKERPDTGVYVKDLSSFVCKSQSEIEHVMSVGNQVRRENGFLCLEQQFLHDFLPRRIWRLKLLYLLLLQKLSF